MGMPAIDPRNIEVVDPQQAAVLRCKTIAERIAMVGDANLAARAMIAAGARSLHPEWTEQQVQAEVVRRMTHGSDRPLTTGG